jgi:hypothetical protein
VVLEVATVPPTRIFATNLLHTFVIQICISEFLSIPGNKGMAGQKTKVLNHIEKQ